MAKSTQRAPDKIEYTGIDKLFLDRQNPRLGRAQVQRGLNQAEVLDIMKDWTLEELGTSFCESGFWPQEALIAIKEKIGKAESLVVVEGNRRLAALKMLEQAGNADSAAKVWKDMIKGVPPSRLKALREDIPYILMPNRDSVKSYLGFRHVTGIKEWHPAEKAQFIVQLIENDGLTYEQVRRRIGSKLPTVLQNYVSYRLLLQMENQSENVDVTEVEKRFSVLYLSLRSEGVKKYLHIKVDADAKTAKKPVPQSRLTQLENFARWLFGDTKTKKDPLFTDSRRVDEFGKILLSEKAVDYLERTERPSFEVARTMAGVSEADVATHIEKAADEAEEALRAAHTQKKSTRVKTAVERLAMDTMQLVKLFPAVLQKVQEELR